MATRKHHHHHHRHRNTFWQEFRFEITVTLLLVTGVALLVEQFEIRRTVWGWIQTGVRFLNRFFRNFFQDFFNFLLSLRLSNTIGVILILIAFFMIFNRFRKKMIVRYSVLYSCPQCGSELARIHRTFYHKVLGLFFWANIRHYKCKKCDYKGIKMDWKQS
ncbi:MAG: hypothetical protein D6762_09215 [Candidatus Neomarinimicrobiota bacterium]|nr:MAG: hypothetical protein D6762_09215 [Candidatus Neomarinimicrobiota bacterium]